MVKIKEDVTKRIIEVKQQVFDTKSVYKALKDKFVDLGYTFFEKEHGNEETKYGREIKFKFEGEKKWDLFAKTKIKIEAKFENVNKVKVDGKELDRCDGTIKITGELHTDYKNQWTLSTIKTKLFDLYSEYFVKTKIKKLYLEPTKNDIEELNKAAKENLGYYYKY